MAGMEAQSKIFSLYLNLRSLVELPKFYFSELSSAYLTISKYPVRAFVPSFFSMM